MWPKRPRAEMTRGPKRITLTGRNDLGPKRTRLKRFLAETTCHRYHA